MLCSINKISCGKKKNKATKVSCCSVLARHWCLPQLPPASFLNHSQTEGHWVGLKRSLYSVLDTKTSPAGGGCADLELCYLRHRAAAVVGKCGSHSFQSPGKANCEERRMGWRILGASRCRIHPLQREDWDPALGLPPCAE